MNERIQELARRVVGKRKDDVASISLFDEQIEQFAELIVRECAQFVEDKFDFIGDEIIVKEKMLEHFGVES